MLCGAQSLITEVFNARIQVLFGSNSYGILILYKPHVIAVLTVLLSLLYLEKRSFTSTSVSWWQLFSFLLLESRPHVTVCRVVGQLHSVRLFALLIK